MTDGRLSPTVLAIFVCVAPSADNNKILARCTRLVSSVLEFAIFCNALLSFADKWIGFALLMDTSSLTGLYPL